MRKKIELLTLLLFILSFLQFLHFAPLLFSPRQIATDTENLTSLPQQQAAPLIVSHGLRDNSHKQVALTFDADMTENMKQQLINGRVKSWYNKKIVDILQATHTHATMFLSGMWIELYPGVTKQLAANQLFELGNHSYDHPSFFGTCFGLPFIPLTNDKDEIIKTQTLLKTVAEVDNKYFRFPGGCFENQNLEVLKKLKMTAIQWDVISGDSFYKNPNDIIKTTLANTQDGSIIVMHLQGNYNAPATADALPQIIDELKKKGYTFVTIAKLLNDDSVTKLVPTQTGVNLKANFAYSRVNLTTPQPFYYKDLAMHE